MYAQSMCDELEKISVDKLAVIGRLISRASGLFGKSPQAQAALEDTVDAGLKRFYGAASGGDVHLPAAIAEGIRGVGIRDAHTGMISAAGLGRAVMAAPFSALSHTRELAGKLPLTALVGSPIGSVAHVALSPATAAVPFTPFAATLESKADQFLNRNLPRAVTKPGDIETPWFPKGGLPEAYQSKLKQYRAHLDAHRESEVLPKYAPEVKPGVGARAANAVKGFFGLAPRANPTPAELAGEPALARHVNTLKYWAGGVPTHERPYMDRPINMAHYVEETAPPLERFGKPVKQRQVPSTVISPEELEAYKVRMQAAARRR